jgi:CheY-like chemotaxis protein
MVDQESVSDESEQPFVGEYRDEVRDTCAELRVLLGNLSSHSVRAEDGLAALRRHVSNLRTQAQALAMPVLKLVTHRLDEYIAELKTASQAEIEEIEVFVGRIEQLIDGESPETVDVPQVVRALPAKRTADIDFGKIEQKNIEILLVVPEKAMARIVERELAACGYRTSGVHDPFVALEMVVRARPDMVISSMELGVLSGVDLGCALAAMPATEGVPLAVLTSYEWGNPKLKGLPPRAGIIRKGSLFGDDLAEVLARFRIT